MNPVDEEERLKEERRERKRQDNERFLEEERLREKHYYNIKLLRIAEWMNTAGDTAVFQRFRKLNIFVLLLLQKRLKHLGNELITKVEEERDIETLLPEVVKSLSQYHEALQSQIDLAKAHEPSRGVLGILRTRARFDMMELSTELELDEKEDKLMLFGQDTTATYRFIEKHEILLRRFENVSLGRVRHFDIPFKTLGFAFQANNPG
ncbi:MAG: hypothetical protein M1833_004319 [Piccolia ochrophora]|nr:MAG: hypothetical protein M1833_004319 [Piccolia ochrophora]